MTKLNIKINDNNSKNSSTTVTIDMSTVSNTMNTTTMENVKTELKKNQMKWQEEMTQTISEINNTKSTMMEQENPTNIEELVLKMKEEFKIQKQENDKEWERRLETQKLNDKAWDRRIKDVHEMTMIAMAKMMEQFFTMIENKVNKKTRTKRKLDIQEDDD